MLPPISNVWKMTSPLQLTAFEAYRQWLKTQMAAYSEARISKLPTILENIKAEANSPHSVNYLV